MPDKDQVRKAIDLTLQAFSYDQLGPAGADLAEGVRRELATLTSGWPEAARAQITPAAGGVERDRHSLDRARNHFIKDFRQRFGMDARRYPPETKAQLDAAMVDFNQRKLKVIDDAAARLLAEAGLDGRPA
ncbi:MAG: hypothetical protein K8T20_13690 [Planctomycetes bacterium]|nr:hypothetical protein [Planctomycetota bacterium]